jgi:hypothetical protein
VEVSIPSACALSTYIIPPSIICLLFCRIVQSCPCYISYPPRRELGFLTIPPDAGDGT